MSGPTNDDASHDSLLEEIAELRRERDALVADERVWVQEASRLAGDGVSDGEEMPNSDLFDTAFFMRRRSVGAITIEETAGATRKGASMVTITRGDENRLFGALIDTAGASVIGAVLSNRIVGLIRGIISTGAITPTDLKRIVVLTQETISAYDLRGRVVSVTAWILNRTTNTLNIICDGHSGFILEREDGTEMSVGGGSAPPLGLLPDILGTMALPDVETIDLEGVAAFRTANDAIENAGLGICADGCEIDTDELEATVREHARRRLACEVPAAVDCLAAGKTLHFDRLGDDLSPLLRIQVAGAALSLTGTVDATADPPAAPEAIPMAGADEEDGTVGGTTVDARLARLIATVLPEVSFSEYGGIATLHGAVLPRTFTPTVMRVSW